MLRILDYFRGILRYSHTPVTLLLGVHDVPPDSLWSPGFCHPQASTQLFESEMLMWVASVREQLMSGAYRTRGFNCFTVVERGKVRDISSVHISERMVKKRLVRYALRPLVMPKIAPTRPSPSCANA